VNVSRSSLVGWLVGALGVLAAAAALAVADIGPGEIGPALGITANGHALRPLGRLTLLGDFPTGSALTPDGRFLWVTDCGHGSNDVRVMDVASGHVVQMLPLPGCYGGIAIAADGRRAYVGGTPKGGSPTEGPTKGDQGDVVHVFTIDAASGHGVEQDPIAIPASSGGSGRTNALPPVSGVGSAYPEGLAISPDARTLLVSLNAADKAAIIDLASGQATLVSTGAYPDGVAFDHQGRGYVSNEYDGTVTVIDVAQAQVVATISGLGGALGDKNSHPEGMVADPRRDRIYVAVTNRDLIAMIDTTSLHVIKTVSVGRPEGLGTAPVKLTETPDGQTLYAADAGEDAIAAVSLSTRPPAGADVARRTVIRVPSLTSITRYSRAQRSALRALAGARGKGAHARALRRYRRRLATLQRRYLRGRTQSACAGPSRRAANAYVRALLGAIARPRRQRARLIARARRALPAIVGCPAAPGYVPNLPADRLIGRLPTAAYPTDVHVTSDGSRLLWIAGKGLGAGPNPTYYFGGDKRPGVTPPKANSDYGTYVLDKLLGRVGTLATPSDLQIRAATASADRQARPANAESPPPGTPVVPNGPIKHVFYIVRENRTYDQIFGSDARGDGDPKLELFDDNGVPAPLGGVTPNAHRLAHVFPLLDHFYADSEVSSDGHVITSSAYATDYVQKDVPANYSGRNRGMDTGIYPVTFPPKDFILDQAARQGVTFRNYGEAGAGTTPFANDGRATYPQVAANTDNTYPNNLFIGCLQPAGPVGNLQTCTQDSGNVDGTGTVIASKSRVNTFVTQFQAQAASGTVPALNFFILPNDHTNGTTPNDYSPQALIADNDLGLGQMVDAISHSSIWASSAIFVLEDDSQDGADHVDAHRMPAFVISPWAKRGAVVHTRYDQYSMLHTAEILLGLAPLSLNDALATPMYDAFATKPDAAGTVYQAIQPTQALNQINTAATPAAALSTQLPWNRIDVVPQAISDQVLWASAHGDGVAPPPPGPNASPIEHGRAVAVDRVLARHGDVRAFLLHGGSGDG
jgi:YVTN family beta-propeller protein